MEASVESTGVGRKKRDEDMAATRVRVSAYRLAKKAADLDGVTTSEYISRVVKEAAAARVAKGWEEFQGRDITGAIKEIKASHEAETEEYRELLGLPKPKAKPKGKGAK